MEAYKAISALTGEVAALKSEMEQMKSIMSMQFGITVGFIALGVISYFIVLR